MLTPVNALALLAGILLCLRLPAPPPAWALIVASALAVLGLCPRLRAQRRWTVPGAVLLAGCVLCALHVHHALALQLPPMLQDQEVALSGRIVDLPQHEARRTRFVLQVDDAATIPSALRGQRVQLAWYDPFDAPAFPQDAPP